MKKVRRAKIVCTLGPATTSEEMISRLIGAGADMIRLNFSHGLREEHGESIRRIRRIAEKKGKPVAILQDLQGPKVRVGLLKEKAIQLKRGNLLTIVPKPIPGTEAVISTTYPDLYKKVRPGDAIMMNDGAIELRVLRIEDEKIICRIIGGGTLQAHKGINVPGRDLGLPSLTAKDRADLRFGLAHGVDYVALSMVHRAKDLMTIKQLIRKEKRDVPVIAKLEQAMAIEHLDEIMKVADGVMVARGDLGVEMPLEQVPLLQKEIIKKANDAQIPVITATQMLESMIERPRPTRAEASDVANAVIDGTDALMLSAETASGNYPVESVETMARIIVAAEKQAPMIERRLQQGISVARAVSAATCQLAWQMNAKAIVTSTLTGGAALRLSKYRPTNPILAFTPHPEIERRMSLYWGVSPRRMPLLKNTDDIFKEFVHAVTRSKEVKRGDLLVMVAKSPWVGLTINDLIKVHEIE